MIDMHAHWRPAEIADALRARTREPRIVRNDNGVEVLKARGGRGALAEAFDERFPPRPDGPPGVRRAYCRCSARSAGSSRSRRRSPWPCAEASTTDCRRSAANIPVVSLLRRTAADRHAAATAELERALACRHNRRSGPRQRSSPARTPRRCVRCWRSRTASARCSSSTTVRGQAITSRRCDERQARRRNGTLDMQASLSSVMVTLCLTDYLAAYPDATVVVHNLGGNFLRGRAHGPPLPARHAGGGAAVVAVPQGEGVGRLQFVRPACDRGGGALYGAERIVCGTDGTEFGSTGPARRWGCRDRRGSARANPAPQRRSAALALSHRPSSAKKPPRSLVSPAAFPG